MTARRLLISPSVATRLPGDEPVELDPARFTAPTGPGEPDGVVGWDRPPTRDRPRTVEVVVDGWRFELEVEDAEIAALRERARRDDGARVSGGPIEVRAIIPGRIVSVDVAMGDNVEIGGHLLVLEAMKMQNELRAPHAGVVVRVAVTAGLTVERGDLLLVLEPHP